MDDSSVWDVGPGAQSRRNGSRAPNMPLAALSLSLCVCLSLSLSLLVGVPVCSRVDAHEASSEDTILHSGPLRQRGISRERRHNSNIRALRGSGRAAGNRNKGPRSIILGISIHTHAFSEPSFQKISRNERNEWDFRRLFRGHGRPFRCRAPRSGRLEPFGRVPFGVLWRMLPRDVGTEQLFCQPRGFRRGAKGAQGSRKPPRLLIWSWDPADGHEMRTSISHHAFSEAQGSDM